MGKTFEEQQRKYRDFLMPGEEMCFVLRPHWRFIVVGVVIGAAIIAGWIAWSYVWGQWLGVNAAIPRTLGSLIALVLLIIFTGRPILEWLVTRYYFTTNRVSTKEGLIAKRRGDVPLDEMANIYYDQGVLDRVLRCGTIKIDSSGGQGFAIENVPNVERVTRDIHILMEGGIPPNRMHGEDGSPIHNSRARKDEPAAGNPIRQDSSDSWGGEPAAADAPVRARPAQRPASGGVRRENTRVTLIRVDYAAEWDEGLTRMLKKNLRLLSRGGDDMASPSGDDGRILEGDTEIAGAVWFVTLTDNEDGEYELDLRNRAGVPFGVAEEAERAALDALHRCGVDDDDILKVDRRVKRGI